MLMEKQGIPLPIHPSLIEAGHAMKAIRDMADAAVHSGEGLTKEQLHEVVRLQKVWEDAMDRYVNAFKLEEGGREVNL